MALFDDILAQLQARDPLPPLFPSEIFSHHISLQITLTYDPEMFDAQVLPEQKQSLRCGLLLLNDDLHASHDISQSIKTSTGSFWHAIMHRREGDASNANYWWRLTGEHPAFALIFENARKYLQNRSEPKARDFAEKMEREDKWNPVDFTQACSDAGPNDEWLRGLQLLEMTTLMTWCRGNN